MGKRKDENGSYWQNMRAYEKGLLEWALQETGDSPLRAAEMLGINTSYLYERCRIVGIVRYGKGKKPPVEDVADATPSPALKLVPPVTEAEDVAEEPEDEEAEAADSMDTEDSVATEDAEEADDEEYEDVGDDECLCGARLVTDDERNKWVECTECRMKRLQSRVIKSAGFAPDPIVVKEDDEDEETA